MERYFLGNNSAYGFFGNYKQELKDKNKVVLLKGGPGTGKSTILKRLAKDAEERGFDYELWFCSGDPKSLDGVFVKNLNIAVVDATAPHATGADLPVIKDVIFDLATSLQRDKLAPHVEEIKRLLNCKKHSFMRAYQHLNIALCHYKNQIALEKDDVDDKKIRKFAIDFYAQIMDKIKAEIKDRKVFVSAICPTGENVYFDHLIGRKIYKVEGCQTSTNVFFDMFKGLTQGTWLLNPLDPNYIDGVVLGDIAIVKDVGLEKEYEVLNLREFERLRYADEIAEERNGVVLEEAFAVQELNRAREYHLEVEKYFVGAMDFENNDILFDRIRSEMF